MDETQIERASLANFNLRLDHQEKGAVKGFGYVVILNVHDGRRSLGFGNGVTARFQRLDVVHDRLAQ